MSENPTSLAAWTDAYFVDHTGSWPFAHYEETVLAAVRHFALRSVVEIGAGRSPLFTQGEFESMGVDYTLNDISQEELDAAPRDIPEDHKVCFDIAGEVADQERFDLVYSKSVFEHVKGTMNAHRNSYALLRKGGIALHFYPTLFSPPFVVNRLVPEAVAARLLDKVVGHEYKKFPALYDHCRSTRRLEREIRAIGYSEVVLVPFWGHSYFHRIAGLRELDNWLAQTAMAHDFRPYTSFCFAIARK